MLRTGLLPFCLVVPLVAGCVASSGTGDPESGDCTELVDGRSFMRPGLDECGLCYCGETAGCNWTVQFADGELGSTFSDYGYHTSYECRDGEILDLDRGGETIATYDAERDVIEYMGWEYEACGGDCQVETVPCDEVCVAECAGLYHGDFRSVTPQPCGACANGDPIECHWILFAGTDDLRLVQGEEESFAGFTCYPDGTLDGEGSGTYDDSTGTLVWEGVEYERCQDFPCDPEPTDCPMP